MNCQNDSKSHQTNVNRYSSILSFQVSQVPSGSHIIESDEDAIIQYQEKETSNAILTNIFGEDDLDSEDDI